MSRRKPLYATIGSISSLYPTEDPIGDLAYKLKYLLKRCRVDRETRKAHVCLLDTAKRFVPTDDNPKTAKALLDLLCEALETFAPPYTTFGTMPNDRGEDEYGFWPIIDNELPRLPAGYEHRDHWGDGDVMLVNDHGNVDCGYFDKRGQWHEYWSCV